MPEAVHTPSALSTVYILIYLHILSYFPEIFSTVMHTVYKVREIWAYKNIYTRKSPVKSGEHNTYILQLHVFKIFCHNLAKYSRRLGFGVQGPQSWFPFPPPSTEVLVQRQWRCFGFPCDSPDFVSQLYNIPETEHITLICLQITCNI